jgi:hypothetical protein
VGFQPIKESPSDLQTHPFAQDRGSGAGEVEEEEGINFFARSYCEMASGLNKKSFGQADEPSFRVRTLRERRERAKLKEGRGLTSLSRSCCGMCFAMEESLCRLGKRT